MMLDEFWNNQVLMRLNSEHARLVVNRKIRGFNRRQLVKQDIVLKELWPLISQFDKLLYVFIHESLDLMLVTVVVVKFLNKFFSVPIDRMAAEHLKAKDALFEVQFIVELRKDNAQWTKTVALTS